MSMVFVFQELILSKIMANTKSVIHCSACDKSWNLPKAYSVYEKQRQESCPCPHCGSYTLTHRETIIKIRHSAEKMKIPHPFANAS